MHSRRPLVVLDPENLDQVIESSFTVSLPTNDTTARFGDLFRSELIINLSLRLSDILDSNLSDLLNSTGSDDDLSKMLSEVLSTDVPVGDLLTDSSDLDSVITTLLGL